MKPEYRTIRIRQNDKSISEPVDTLRVPKAGWIREIRDAIGMTRRQLARRLRVTPQSADELETGEVAGSITVARLRRAADALDCRLVYALVPKQGSLDALVRERAELVARRLVLEVEQSMRLEDQGRDTETLREEIRFRAEELARKPGRALWEDA